MRVSSDKVPRNLSNSSRSMSSVRGSMGPNRSCGASREESTAMTRSDLLINHQEKGLLIRVVVTLGDGGTVAPGTGGGKIGLNLMGWHDRDIMIVNHDLMSNLQTLIIAGSRWFGDRKDHD